MSHSEGSCVQPGVLQALRRRRSAVRLHFQHGKQEVTELRRLVQRPLVLLQQDLEQTPRLEVGDVTQLTWKHSGSGTGRYRLYLNRRGGVSPLLLKYSLEYLPDRAKGKGMGPSSSMMWAM